MAPPSPRRGTSHCHASPVRDARLPCDSGSNQEFGSLGSHRRSGPSALLTTAQRFPPVTPRLFATRGFPATRTLVSRLRRSRRPRSGPSALLTTARTLPTCHASRPPQQAISRPTAGKPIRGLVPPWALPIHSRLMTLLPGARTLPTAVRRRSAPPPDGYIKRPPFRPPAGCERGGDRKPAGRRKAVPRTVSYVRPSTAVRDSGAVLPL